MLGGNTTLLRSMRCDQTPGVVPRPLVNLGVLDKRADSSREGLGSRRL